MYPQFDGSSWEYTHGAGSARDNLTYPAPDYGYVYSVDLIDWAGRSSTFWFRSQDAGRYFAYLFNILHTQYGHETYAKVKFQW